MEKVTKIRIKRPNGTFTDPVPIGAESENITTAGGFSLEEVLGNINLNTEGSIKQQIQSLLRSQEINSRNDQNVSIKVNGLEQYLNDLNQNTSDLSSELKLTKDQLSLKVDGARVDEQGFLYLLSGQQTIVGPLGPFNGTGGGSGGSGGGGTNNNAVLTLTNTSGWITKSIASGTDLNITCNWSSIEEESPTGPGTVIVYVNGITRQTIGVQQGDFTIKVGSLLTTGRNSVRVNLSDIYGNSKNINYTITVVNAVISSSFNTNMPFSGDILFPYTPQGDLNKTVYFILDGEQIGTQEVAASGRQITYTIPEQSYGTHSLEVYFIGDMDGVDIESNHLYFEFAAIDEEHNVPIITSSFTTTETEQYTTLAIPYRVYSPTSITSLVTLKVNGETLTTINVDRAEQVWSYRCDNDGELILRIEVEEVFKEFTIQVTKSSANIYAETENLALYLSSNNRNNGEANPAIWEYEDISATFSNFNFVSDGWQLDNNNNTILRLMGDARVSIPYKPFEKDCKTTGKTIEIEFATKQVADYSTTLLSCYDDNMGLLITPQSITFNGAQTRISTLYKENEHIRLSIVIGKQNNYRLILIYINGIMSRAIQYASGERFTQLNPVGITIGSNDCDIDLYNIRIYDNDLNRTQILGNWIADTQDSELKLSRYNKNNVYNEYDEVVSSKLKLPYMILQAEELSQYKGDKKTISVIYTDPNNSTKSFSASGVQLNVQGTSSSVYFRKNYDLQFKEGFVTGSGNVNDYALRTGSIPFNRFVLKADVASSESTNNTGLTMFYNDTCPYKTPEMLSNSKVRWGIEGIPIVVYWRNTNTNKIEFLGKHNFNLPKRAPAPYGYGDSDTLESWEWERNNSDNVKFKDNDFSTLSWDEAEQKYYPEWYNDFEARFPSDEWRDYTKLNELISWVKSTYREAATGDDLPEPVVYKLNSTITVNNYTQDTSYTVEDEMDGGTRTGYSIFTFTKDTPAYRLTKFKAQFSDYFEQESALFYYLFTELFTMIDSRAKNMFIGFNGSPINDSNRAMDRKATLQPYDMDTAIGTNNSGVLMFGYYHEDGDHVSNIISGGDGGGSEAPVFNAQDSVLWSNVRDSFRSQLMTMYRSLRASGAWSYQAVENMYENHQSAWCEAIFNEDSYIKYLYPLVEAVTKDEETGNLIRTDRYLTMLQGSKTEQRKWWLYNRFRYMDSKFNTGNASSSTLDIRLFNSGTLTITPINDMYASVAFGLGSTPVMKRTLANEPVSFEYTQASGVTEMETSIFSGDMITDLGDLSVFYPNEINFAKGTKLKHLKIGDADPGYSNSNLKVLDVSNSPLLESIDCRNCPALASTINLENSPRLQEAYFDGTAVTGVDLADGCIIETLHLPSTITTLTLMNLTKLTECVIPSYQNISRLMLTHIDQNIIDPVDILKVIKPKSLINLQDISLEMETADDIEDFLDMLDTMQGVTREKGSNGDWLYYESEKAQVNGEIHTYSLSGDQIEAYKARYPYIDFTADHVTTYLTYKSYNGDTTLKTVTCIDGVPQEAAPAIPARADSTDGHYSYTGIGWSTTQDSQIKDDTAITNVNANRTVYAVYQWNVKTYTVTWKNSNGTTLETDNNVVWGTTPTYNGSTPTDPSGNNSPFTVWTPEISNVTGNVIYTANYKPVWTVTFMNQAGTSTLQTKSIVDGNTASYTGTTPTNEDQTTFLGWSNSINSSTADAVLTNIKADKTVYAAFEAVVQDIEITDTWDQIINNIDNGTYKTKYKLGNYKPLDLGTTYGTINMQIVAIDGDELASGGYAPLTFLAKELLLQSHNMNSSNTTEGGWANSSIRNWLNSTIKSLIPSNISIRLQNVNKTFDETGSRVISTSVDKIWLPSIREIRPSSNHESSGVTYYKLYTTEKETRLKTQNGSVGTYWTRTAYNSSGKFVYIPNWGDYSYGDASVERGVCIGFCLGLEPETISDSWDTILANENYATDYNIGDTKYLDLGTEGKQLMEIVAFDTDDRADGNGKAGITWISKGLLNTEIAMIDSTWRDSAVRNVLTSTVYELIPSNVKTKIINITKSSYCYNKQNSSFEFVNTNDMLWIPSCRELNTPANKETSGYIYSNKFNDNTSRIKKRNGNEWVYLTRTAAGSASIYAIKRDGAKDSLGYGNLNVVRSVALGFCTN